MDEPNEADGAEPRDSDVAAVAVEDTDGHSTPEDGAATPATGSPFARWVRRIAGTVRLPGSAKGRLVLGIVVVLLLGSSAGAYAWHRSTQLPEDVAFQVAGRDVTENELGEYSETMRALYGVKAPTGTAKLSDFRRDLAKAYAFNIVVENEAQRHDIVISDKTAQDVLGRYIRDQFGEGQAGRDKFIRLLGATGTNEQAVLDEIKRQLLLGKLFNKVTADVRVSEPEVRTAYDERKSEFTPPEERALRNIVVAERAQADAVIRKLNRGVPFATVAAEDSIDASTRNKGGDLGTVTADQLEKDYAVAAFGASEGEVFGPIKTRHGWNIGKVDGIHRGDPPAYAAIHDRLKQALGLEQAVTTWRTWLEDRVRDADIEYADRYHPPDPNTLPEGGPGMPAVTSGVGAPWGGGN